jgi:hypothetical protein
MWKFVVCYSGNGIGEDVRGYFRDAIKRYSYKATTTALLKSSGEKQRQVPF